MGRIIGDLLLILKPGGRLRIEENNVLSEICNDLGIPDFES